MKRFLPKDFLSNFFKKSPFSEQIFNSARGNSGQALIVILLVMAVGLTVALAIISRSITDIRVSRQEEESARAFSIAEAGLEQALISKLPGTYPVGTEGDSALVAVADECSGGGQIFNFGGEEFDEGKVQSVWLVGHTGGLPDSNSHFPEDGQITLCWGKSGTSEEVAIEASLIYKVSQLSSEFRVARGAFDVDPTSHGNNFNPADGTGGGYCGDLQYKEELVLNGSPADSDGNFQLTSGNIPYLLRLKLLYNTSPQPIVVYGNGDNFPFQGEGYDVTANVAGGASTRIRHCQFYESLPEAFDYVLFSEGDLSHN